MQIFFSALAIFVIVTTSLSSLRRRQEWWVRMHDFPRPQLFLFAAAALAGLLLSSDGGWLETLLAAGAAVVLVYQGVKIYPYTPLARKEVRDASQVREGAALSLLVANVLMENREADRLIEIVRGADPDLLLTLEPDAWWEERLRTLEEELPYTVKEPLDNRYGMILYSRLELVDPEVKFLVKEGIPSIHARLRLRSGREVELRCLHPEPPSPTEAEESTERDAELLRVGRAVAELERPVIVAGDFNDVSWSHTTALFRKASGLLDPRIGRGMFTTFDARYFFFRFPIDQVFHSSEFLLAELRRLPAFGSDHFPFLVRLCLEPVAKLVQSPPDLDAESRTEIEHKVEQVEPLEEP